MTAAPGHNSTEIGTVPPPDPPDPQPVPDAYRCGDLNDEWEVQDYFGAWRAPSEFPSSAIRPARRKQAPPLTPREGDTVRTKYGAIAEVICIIRGSAFLDDGKNAPFSRPVSHLTVTDRPPKRPVRVWLTDEQVQSDPTDPEDWAWSDAVDALVGACRALVGGEG